MESQSGADLGNDNKRRRTKHIYSTYALIAIIIIVLGFGVDSILPEQNTQNVINPIYFEWENYDEFIYFNNHTQYYNSQAPIYFTKDNMTLFQSIYAGDIYSNGVLLGSGSANVSLENVAMVNQSNNFTKWQQIGKLFICDIDENTSVMTIDEAYARANCTNT